MKTHKEQVRMNSTLNTLNNNLTLKQALNYNTVKNLLN